MCRYGDVFDNAYHIGKLQIDELDLVLLCTSQEVGNICGVGIHCGLSFGIRCVDGNSYLFMDSLQYQSQYYEPCQDCQSDGNSSESF